MLILMLINVSELCPCTVPQESIKLPVTLLSIKINSVAETFKDDETRQSILLSVICYGNIKV